MTMRVMMMVIMMVMVIQWMISKANQHGIVLYVFGIDCLSKCGRGLILNKLVNSNSGNWYYHGLNPCVKVSVVSTILV